VAQTHLTRCAGGPVTLERMRSLLLGNDVEPDTHARDMRLFFAMSWGLASSPAICPLTPDQLDGQLSQVCRHSVAVLQCVALLARARCGVDDPARVLDAGPGNRQLLR
jgi:hypothetical protein